MSSLSPEEMSVSLTKDDLFVDVSRHESMAVQWFSTQ